MERVRCVTGVWSAELIRSAQAGSSSFRRSLSLHVLHEGAVSGPQGPSGVRACGQSISTPAHPSHSYTYPANDRRSSPVGPEERLNDEMMDLAYYGSARNAWPSPFPADFLATPRTVLDERVRPAHAPASIYNGAASPGLLGPSTHRFDFDPGTHSALAQSSLTHSGPAVPADSVPTTDITSLGLAPPDDLHDLVNTIVQPGFAGDVTFDPRRELHTCQNSSAMPVERAGPVVYTGDSASRHDSLPHDDPETDVRREPGGIPVANPSHYDAGTLREQTSTGEYRPESELGVSAIRVPLADYHISPRHVHAAQVQPTSSTQLAPPNQSQTRDPGLPHSQVSPHGSSLSRSTPRSEYGLEALNRLCRPSPSGSRLSLQGGEDIEAVAAWGDVTFFISLHVRHQHALVPFMHRPSFAWDILFRRDQRDEAFRGLLFSISEFSRQ